MFTVYVPITLKSRDKRNEETKCTMVPPDFYFFLMEEATESPCWRTKIKTQNRIWGIFLHFCCQFFYIFVVIQARPRVSVCTYVCGCVFPEDNFWHTYLLVGTKWLLLVPAGINAIVGSGWGQG